MGEGLRRCCAISCVKTLLMIFNVCFWLSGLMIIWAGIWMQTDMESYLKVSTGYSSAAPCILVGIGIVILFVATLACSCTIKGQPAMLYLYGGFLVIILFVEVALAASMYAYRDRLAEGFDQGLKQDIRNYTVSPNHNCPIDIIQKKLKCCGVNSYRDWYELNPTKEVPETCCINPEKCRTQESIDVYGDGCIKKLIDILNSNMSLIGAVASGVAFAPLIGTILSCCLASNAKKAKYEQVN